MKNIYLLILVTLFATKLSAQYQWDFGVTAGLANYVGEIGGKEKDRRDFLLDLKMPSTRWGFGGFAQYKWRPKISFKGSFEYLRIAGDDKLSTNLGRNARNLSFKNDMFSLAVTGEYFFFENNDLGNTYRFKNGFRAYVFAGIGGFYSNPKANYQGEWVALRPLQTENVKYSAFGFDIPYGLGFYFTVNKKHRIGFEARAHKTFTDYLDDVSGQFADPATQTPLAAALGSRTNELTDVDPALAKNYIYNTVDNPGNKRGDPTHKDQFMSMNFSYSYVLRGKSSFYKKQHGNFFGGRKHGKVRKIRAKF